MKKNINSSSDYVTIIGELYPPDSIWESTGSIGRELLLESILEFGWENLPEELLRIYAEKCKQRD